MLEIQGPLRRIGLMKFMLTLAVGAVLGVLIWKWAVSEPRHSPEVKLALERSQREFGRIQSKSNDFQSDVSNMWEVENVDGSLSSTAASIDAALKVFNSINAVGLSQDELHRKINLAKAKLLWIGNTRCGLQRTKEDDKMVEVIIFDTGKEGLEVRIVYDSLGIVESVDKKMHG